MARAARTPGRSSRTAAVLVAAALTVAALTSPWWQLGVTTPTRSVVFGNWGVRVWWVSGANTFQTRPVSFGGKLGDSQDCAGWWFVHAPNVWVPNAWIPAWIVLAPFWALAVGAVLLPRARPRPGRCPACGYATEGLPARSGETLCPECGLRLSPAAGRKG